MKIKKVAKPARASKRVAIIGDKPPIQASKAEEPVTTPESGFWVLLLGLILVGLFVIYVPTFSHGYVYYDDDRYVYDNPVIRGGLTAANVTWAFTTFLNANWHPLTWISYFIDYQLFGINAGPQHVVNFLFHLGSTVLLFLALSRITEKKIPSAIVSGIFALHPLHVESVAWVAERKDVLSTFFEMLTLWAYARYAARPRLATYSMVVVSYSLSLLSKPMAVTLPFVLLLLDFWPLRRLDLDNWRTTWKDRRVLWEKVPLFVMAMLASGLTVVAQQQGSAVQSLTHLSIADRLVNALIAYCRYIGLTILPIDLGVLYPSQEGSLAGKGILAALLLCALTAGAWRLRKQQPFILMGWLWFLGTLLPVIGIIQVGAQTVADRYTYFPMVGLSIASVWAVEEYARLRPVVARPAAAAAIAALVVLALLASRQAGYWVDSETLFRHTLAVTGNNPIVENNLGVVLQREGRLDEAANLYREAIAGIPDYTSAQTNLGTILAGQGKTQEAIALYRHALSEDPRYTTAHANLGSELLAAGQFSESYAQLSEAIREDPQLAQARGDMGVLLAAQGRFTEAKPFLEQADTLSPNQAKIKGNLCFVLVHLNALDAAASVCTAALKLDPNSLTAHYNLGTALAGKGMSDAAATEFSWVLERNPNYTEARTALAALHNKN
jgi:protein O-mannosyl-transferase